MNPRKYEEMHDEWHRNIDKTVELIHQAKELVGELSTSIFTAISTWGERGVETKEGEIIPIDVASHARFSERCLIITRLFEIITQELTSDISI